MLKNRKTFKAAIGLLLALAVLGSIVLFHFRSLEDKSNTNVSIIMDYNDIIMLDFDDISDVASQLAAGGLNAVIFSDSETINQDITASGKLKYGYSPVYLTSVQDYLSTYTVEKCDFPLLTSYSLPAEGGEKLTQAGISVALRYDLSTGDSSIPDNFDSQINDSLLLVEVPYEITSGANGYDFSECVAAVADAVSTGGVRAIAIPTLIDSNVGIITDVQIYVDYISQLCTAVHSLGFYTGGNFYSSYKSGPIALIPMLLVFFGVCAAIMIFINTFKQLSVKKNFLILGIMLCLSAVGFILLREITAKLLGIAVRITLPCLAFYLLTKFAGKFARSNGNYGLIYGVICAASISSLSGLIILLGELTANLLMLNSEAFSGLVSFELTFFVDIAVCLYLVYITFKHIYKAENTTAGEYFGGLWYSLWNHITRTLSIVLAIIIAVILYFLALRNTFSLLGSEIGSAWFNIIGCSPRMAQYIIGYPLGSLALVLCARRMQGIAWPFVLLSSVNVFSLNNMFSTALEPISRSLEGAIVGCLLGFIVSLILCGIVTAIIRSVKFRHEGMWWNR